MVFHLFISQFKIYRKLHVYNISLLIRNKLYLKEIQVNFYYSEACMNNTHLTSPVPKNEPVLSYIPNSQERAEVKAEIHQFRKVVQDIPMIIGGNEVRTHHLKNCICPHEHQHKLGHYHIAESKEIELAIASCLNVRKEWSAMPWEERAAIFLKAADLISGPYRQKMNAATMLCQSKNIFQAEIDAVCELVDFFRFNVKYMEEVYSEQPASSPTIWNRLQYRGLEGFITAITPFNFTSIAGNLPVSCALMGNTVVWKPSRNQIYSAALTMEILIEAGLPPGVINMVFGNAAEFSKITLSHPDFAGVHFTGSTPTFQHFWKMIGEHISDYKTYPRIVGETGGKDFILAHPSADPDELRTALIRGAFEYQGQKCSAASRAYIPWTLWNTLFDHLKSDLDEIKTGPVENFENFINAVIDKKAFDKIVSYIEFAKKDPDLNIIQGGTYTDSEGYFIKPTVILTKNPFNRLMQEEIFGPVLTVYVYDDHKFDETIEMVNRTSRYALTGAVFSKDRSAIQDALNKLEHAAGNFYINDKPTGAVVGQQPFGGSRASGTNDKAGSKINLMRWVSARTIKECFNPPKQYAYPFLGSS